MNRATSTITLPSARIRRRRLRFSPFRLRQRFRGCSQAIFLTVWIVAGLSTYGLVWASFWYPTFTGAAEKNSHMSVLEEDASFFSSLANSKRTSQSHRKHAIKEQGEASKRLRKHTPEKLRKSMEEAEEGFTTIGFWIIFILWGYQKVKERFPVSASSITERRPEWSTSSVTPPLQSQMTTLQIRRIHREVIVRTLRRINQEREERDEELISVEAIEAFQNALLQDQEVWEGLAEQRGSTRTCALGATRQEIDACKKRLPNECDDGECIICLHDLASDNKKMLRVLPCNHGFHACCIDKWFKRSTQCPICKASIRKEDASAPE